MIYYYMFFNLARECLRGGSFQTSEAANISKNYLVWFKGIWIGEKESNNRRTKGKNLTVTMTQLFNSFPRAVIEVLFCHIFSMRSNSSVTVYVINLCCMWLDKYVFFISSFHNFMKSPALWSELFQRKKSDSLSSALDLSLWKL